MRASLLSTILGVPSFHEALGIAVMVDAIDGEVDEVAQTVTSSCTIRRRTGGMTTIAEHGGISRLLRLKRWMTRRQGAGSARCWCLCRPAQRLSRLEVEVRRRFTALCAHAALSGTLRVSSFTSGSTSHEGSRFQGSWKWCRTLVSGRWIVCQEREMMEYMSQCCQAVCSVEYSAFASEPGQIGLTFLVPRFLSVGRLGGWCWIHCHTSPGVVVQCRS